MQPPQGLEITAFPGAMDVTTASQRDFDFQVVSSVVFVTSI